MILKKEIKRWVLVIIITAVIFTLVLQMGQNLFYMKNIPEQVEQAEVVGKRIEPARDSDSYPYYYVTFKFSDGSEKEFEAGRPNKNKHYNAINEGDTGKLTYKEKGKNRRFESFEKDPDLGGMKIEPYRLDDRNEIIYVIILCVVFVPLMVSLLKIINKNNNTANKNPLYHRKEIENFWK